MRKSASGCASSFQLKRTLCVAEPAPTPAPRRQATGARPITQSCLVETKKLADLSDWRVWAGATNFCIRASIKKVFLWFRFSNFVRWSDIG
jgi:hypothetical protein